MNELSEKLLKLLKEHAQEDKKEISLQELSNAMFTPLEKAESLIKRESKLDELADRGLIEIKRDPDDPENPTIIIKSPWGI